MHMNSNNIIKKLIAFLIAVAVIVAADAVIINKTVEKKLSEANGKESSAQADTDSEKEPAEQTEDKEDRDYVWDEEAADFLTEYYNHKPARDIKYHIYSEIAEERIADIFVGNDGMGVATCDPDGGAGSTYAKLLTTKDGGKSWTEVQRGYTIGGRMVVIDKTIMHFKFHYTSLESSVILLDMSGNEKKKVMFRELVGLDEDEALTAIPEILEVREHSVVVGWKEAWIDEPEGNYPNSDFGRNLYRQYVYVAEFDSELNELERLYVNKDILNSSSK